MSNFKTIDEARAYFSGDRFATENGMTLDECDENHAVTSLVLGARHRNALGGVMGGAIFTLADFAFAALTNDRERAAVAPSSRRPRASAWSPRRATRRTGAPLAW